MTFTDAHAAADRIRRALPILGHSRIRTVASPITADTYIISVLWPDLEEYIVTAADLTAFLVRHGADPTEGL